MNSSPGTAAQVNMCIYINCLKQSVV